MDRAQGASGLGAGVMSLAGPSASSDSSGGGSLSTACVLSCGLASAGEGKRIGMAAAAFLRADAV